MGSFSAGSIFVKAVLLAAVVGLASAAPATAQIIWRPPPGSNVYVTPSPVADTTLSTPSVRVASPRPATLPVRPEALRALPLLVPSLTPDPLGPPLNASREQADEPSTVPYDWPIEYARSLFDSLFPSFKAAITGTMPPPPDTTIASNTP